MPNGAPVFQTFGPTGNDNNNNWLWAWLLTGGGYGGRGGYGGGYGGQGAGAPALLHNMDNGHEAINAHIEGLRTTMLANTEAAQHDSIKDSVRAVQDIFTQLSHTSEVADCGRHTELLNKMAECCCRTQESITRISSEICALGNNMNMQFANLNNSMTNGFANAANDRCNKTRDIIDATREEGRETRALINGNTVKELEQKLADAQRREQTQTIIAELKAECGDNGGWYGSSATGGFVPPGQAKSN